KPACAVWRRSRVNDTSPPRSWPPTWLDSSRASAGTRDVLDEPEASATGAPRRPVADASGSSKTALAPALGSGGATFVVGGTASPDSQSRLSVRPGNKVECEAAPAPG